MSDKQISRKQLRDKWEQKIKVSEQKYAEYYDLVNKIRSYYRNDSNRNKQNIFWSSIETLKPFLYFKQPEPFIVRQNKTPNKVETLACKILERALIWNMRQFDFDSVIKYARNDFLLSGMGLLWEQYRPTFRQIGDAFIKDKEQVDTVYVSPTMFLTDTEKVNVWEDVEWIARKTFMNMDEIEACFLPDVTNYLYESYGDEKIFTVYEIWDKPSKNVYYLCSEFPHDFLQVNADALKVSGFFPCPKPIMGTLTNDGIIPVPDYVEIKSLLDELDGVNNRMRLTMQALKVSGCYDNSFPELANILDKDVTLISVSDFDKLKDAGGIRGIIDFAPIEQYVSALQVLAQRRQVLIEAIYEVTGVSDIMRGSSDVRETATAINEKTHFGTLRNQDRQNDMQRFLKDLLRIKAEIICEHFAPEFLLSFLNISEREDMETATAAVKLLKTEKLRKMAIDLETDGCYNQDKEEDKILTTLKYINEMLLRSFDIVSKQPALLPLYRQMIESAVATMPNARQFDNIMESAFNKIEDEFNKPEPAETHHQETIVDLEKQKNLQNFLIKKEQNDLKREELNLKKITELHNLKK